ncbi:MAG TPA: hypothetical protein VHE60_15795 [Pyrinomonadaceae bacterium]|nr:hypothetical protein [Pyrinomonadaceae bacterium]
MRLKLVLLTSLLGAVIGAGASIGIVVGTLGSLGFTFALLGYKANMWMTVVTYLPPIVAALLAGIFVYRHTARRRKLQAALTGTLVLLFCLIAFLAMLLRYILPT